MEQNQEFNRRELIQEIKQKLPLESLISSYGIKQGTSKNSYFCPFHEDKKPSFVASNEKGWKCFSSFSCGSGDQISFIQKYENISFEEAIKKASELANISKHKDISTPKDKKPFSTKALEQTHIQYLNSRGIELKTALYFKLKAKGDYILFPQNREGSITGYKGINFKTKRMFFEGTDKASKLFPDYRFEKVKHVIFTAGEYDCMYLTQKLLENNLNEYKVVTSSTGESSFPRDLERLENFKEIESFKIFYDHDKTGKVGAEKLAKELLKFKKLIEIYNFPEDKEDKYDVSDFFNEGNNIEALFALEKKVIEPKITIVDEQIKRLADLKFDLSNLKHYFTDTIDDYTFITPENYEITQSGVVKITLDNRGEEKKVEKILGLPVLITEKSINTDDGKVNLRIAFKMDGEWKEFVVEKEIISDNKKIISLSGMDFPVHSTNAKKVIEYLHDFELANLPILKKTYITQDNGWKEFKKQKGFGLGSHILGLDPEKDNISFYPEFGFERFTKSLNAKGSFEEWVKTISPIMKTNRKVAFAVYASLSAPLLKLLDCASFLVHFWGDSSMGKTTVMEIAGSVWGNPAKETGGLVTSWNNTMVFVERLASFFNDMPMFLDDSQTADDKTVSKIMYMIGNSTGRGRGKKAGGVDATNSWHTVCFSTGEKQLTESTQYDGAKARTIEIAGSPFGRNEGKVVNAVKSCVRENYGHIGTIFINDLLKRISDPEKMEELKDCYKTFRDMLTLKTSSEIGNRMAHYFSIIQLAGVLIEESLDLGGNPLDAITECFVEALKERKSEGDTATRALHEILSYSQANMKSFLGKSDEFAKEHFGVWKESEYIAFYPHKLKEVLSKYGFSFNSIIRSWGDRDWIRKDPERSTLQISFGGQRLRVIAIRWEIINYFM